MPDSCSRCCIGGGARFGRGDSMSQGDLREQEAGVSRGHLHLSRHICPHSPACSGPRVWVQLPSPRGPCCIGPQVGPQRPAHHLSTSFLLSKWLGGLGAAAWVLDLAAGPPRRSWARGVCAPSPACPGARMEVAFFSGPGGPLLGEHAEQQHPGALRGCQPRRSELSLEGRPGGGLAVKALPAGTPRQG